MSGTTKITNFVVDGATPIPAGGTLKTKWSVPAGSPDEYRQDGRQVENADGTKPANPVWASWGRVTTPAFSKGGLPNGVWEARVTARRGGADIAGSTSDTLAVRVGPAPVVQPTPTPTPTPTPAPAPTYATAADLAALASRVAALEKAQPATGTTATAGVLPADLPRGGGVVTGDATLVVRAGEVVVATAK